MPSLPDNPAVYVAIVAIIALIPSCMNAWASALPHIRSFKKGHALDVQIVEQLAITHSLGNVSVGIQVSIRNTGGYTAFVKRIQCAIRSRDAEPCLLTAHAYGLDGNANRVLNGIHLRPDERWDAFIVSFKQLLPADRVEVGKFTTKIHDSLQASIQSIPVGQAQVQRAEADPAAVQPALDFFRRHFFLRLGEYELAVAFVWDGGQPVVRTYRFTLHLPDIEALENLTANYKYAEFGSFIVPVSVELESASVAWAATLLAKQAANQG